MKYTDDQQAFIDAPVDAHIRVIAPPGSGKSQIMCERLCTLERAGLDMQKVRVTMFNKAAAIDVKDRLSAMGCRDLPVIRHYHSLGHKLVAFMMEAGALPKLNLITSQNTIRPYLTAALSHMAEHHRVSFDIHASQTIEDFVGFISRVKSDIISPEQTFEESDLDTTYKPFVDAYHHYVTLKLEGQFRDFDDLLYEPTLLLSKNDSLRRSLSNKVSHFFIDEYQDINSVTAKLFFMLGGDKAWFNVIGDDDQSINGFRGAKPAFLISGFTAQFASVQTLLLRDTFRYGHKLALCANNLITHNKDRVDKMCFSHHSTPHTDITFGTYQQGLPLPYADPKQASLINCIKDAQNDGSSLGDIAILLRVYNIFLYIELALLKHQIPYHLDGKAGIHHHKGFKGLIGILTHHPHYPGNQTRKAEALAHFLSLGVFGVPFSQHLQLANAFIEQPDDFQTHCQELLPDIPSHSKKVLIDRLFTLHKGYQQYSGSVQEFYVFVFSSHLVELMEKATKRDHQVPKENLALANMLVDYLEDVNSFDALHALLSQDGVNKEDKVTITSMHKSKGLSIPIVIIAGACDTVTPNIQIGKVLNMEDERRLFYVAITRAVKRLHIITPHDKDFIRAQQMDADMIPRQTDHNVTRASPFVFEMNPFPALLSGQALYDDALVDLPAVKSPRQMNQYLSKLDTPIRFSQG